MRKRTTSLLLIAAGLAFPLLADKKAMEQYVLLYGTVFRETGFTLPNAEVTVLPDMASAPAGAKVKKMNGVSNGRGEFAFHLPAVNMRYTVRVSAKGYQTEEKPVVVEGPDRLDITVQLQPESK